MKCVYCGKNAQTREHVPARCFLEKPYPINLNTLPACIQCNRGYALDEEYLLATLAQIGTQSTLTSKVEEGGKVARAFERSPAFKERFLKSMKVDPTGRIHIAPELDRINRVLQKTAFGLFVVRYKKIPTLKDFKNVQAYPYNINDVRGASKFLLAYNEKFQPKRWNHIQRDIFSYMVVRDSMNNNQLTCLMDFHNTLWVTVDFPEPSVIARRGKSIKSLDNSTQPSLF